METTKNITMAEIARRANVAINTASKVFQGDESVRPYIRERVLAEAKKANYTANNLARAMRTKKFNLVSFHITDFYNPFFGRLFEVVSGKLSNKGIMVVQCSGVDSLNETNQSTFACATILANSRPEKISQVIKSSPMITINSYTPDAEQSSGVYVDFESAYREMTARVVKSGRRNIGYYCPANELTPNERKFNVISDELAKSGIVPIREGQNSFNTPEEAVDFALTNKLDTVFCSNDILAVELLIRALHSNIRVPEDLLVVGCDGTFANALIWTIKVDIDLLADIAVKLLEDVLIGNRDYKQVRLVPEVISQGFVQDTITI